MPRRVLLPLRLPPHDGALRGFDDLSFIEHQTNEIISASRRRRTTTSQKVGLAPRPVPPLPLNREKNVFPTRYEGIYQPSTGKTACRTSQLKSSVDADHVTNVLILVLSGVDRVVVHVCLWPLVSACMDPEQECKKGHAEAKTAKKHTSATYRRSGIEVIKDIVHHAALHSLRSPGHGQEGEQNEAG